MAKKTKKAVSLLQLTACFVVVRPKRFELLAYRFVACCSIQLSYERVVKSYV